MKLNPKRRDLTQEQRDDKIKRDRIARGELPTQEEEITGLKSVSSALIGGDAADDLLTAQSVNHLLRMYAQSLPEDKALEVAAVYPAWKPNVEYPINAIVRHGLNQDNEPQIYRVIQAHTSQEDWPPDQTASLFLALGFTETGWPIWVQPLGAHDAYQKGDIVSYNGSLFESTADNNVWAPGVFGWKPYVEPTQKIKGGGK